MPIHCQYYANPRSIFLWIFANPCRSMPILANPMPISGQSVTSYVIYHRTSPLYGMVPSLIGGWIKANSPVIDWQVVGTGPNPLQSWQIQWQFQANPCQPMPLHVPIAGQFFTKKGKFVNCPIWANPSKSNANPCQSNANFRPFTWAIPALKLGTSPLYGLVPSLLGGRTKANSAVIDWQTNWHWAQSLTILTNPVPIPRQSMSTHANPRQPMPIHVPIAGQFFTKKESLSIVQSEPILANPMPIPANPMPIPGHFRGHSCT